MKYIVEDVIRYANDSRLKDAIGKTCYGGQKPEEALIDAKDDKFRLILDSANDMGCAFIVHNEKGTYGFPFIVLEKDSPRIVPFDFSKKEDRDALMGKRIHTKEEHSERYEEFIVTRLTRTIDGDWFAHGISSNDLTSNYVFADTGKPVGKEIEV